MRYFADIARRLEFSALLAGLVIAGACWAFVELMEVARDSAPHSFDTRILLAFREAGDPARPIGPFWLEQAMTDITSLGSTSVLVFITTATIGYLLIARNAGAALFVLVVVGGGQLLSSVLKLGIDRPRPDLVSHLVNVHTLSFPSGHAMLSAVTYLTLGAMLARVLPGAALQIYVMFVAVLATVLIGLSRIYLGVHWPSDVLAGWCAGFAWAMACWLMATRTMLRDRHPSGG